MMEKKCLKSKFMNYTYGMLQRQVAIVKKTQESP